MEYVYLDEQEIREFQEVAKWTRNNEHMKELMTTLKKMKIMINNDADFVDIVKGFRKLIEKTNNK